MKKVLSVVICASALVIGCSPTDYEVVRKIEINAPAAVVFEQVNTLKNRDAWSPWEAMDPEMKKTYEGPESGVGAIYHWSGNDSVGTGYLEILESVPYNSIKSQLVFTSPWKSTSTIEWSFAENEGKTVAVWKTKGELPGYMFWMTAKTMDDMMGPDFENGLNALKTVCEEKSADDSIEIALVEVEAFPYYFISDEISFSEISEDFFDKCYKEIVTYLGEDAAKINKPPFAIYHSWDEERQITRLEVAMAADSDLPGNERVKKSTTYSGTVVQTTFQGPYEATEEVHVALHQYAAENQLEIVSSPWESYLIGPGDTDNNAEWLTEISYPVASN